MSDYTIEEQLEKALEMYYNKVAKRIKEEFNGFVNLQYGEDGKPIDFFISADRFQYYERPTYYKVYAVKIDGEDCEKGDYCIEILCNESQLDSERKDSYTKEEMLKLKWNHIYFGDEFFDCYAFLLDLDTELDNCLSFQNTESVEYQRNFFLNVNDSMAFTHMFANFLFYLKNNLQRHENIPSESETLRIWNITKLCLCDSFEFAFDWDKNTKIEYILGVGKDGFYNTMMDAYRIAKFFVGIWPETFTEINAMYEGITCVDNMSIASDVLSANFKVEDLSKYNYD